MSSTRDDFEDGEFSDEDMAPLPLTVVDPEEQRAIQVREDSIVDSARVGSQVYISIPNVCAFLGLQPQGQTARIRRHYALSQGIQMISLKTRGGTQPTLCLDADMVPTWLLTIHPKKAKPEFQQMIIDYQLKMMRVIRNVYYAYALANDSTHGHLARILDQILDEIREVKDTELEQGHVLKLLLAMEGDRRQLPPTSNGKPALRIVNVPSRTEQEQPSLIEGHIMLTDYRWGNGNIALIFDDRTGLLTVAGSDGQRVMINPEQILEMMTLLRERRSGYLRLLAQHDA